MVDTKIDVRLTCDRVAVLSYDESDHGFYDWHVDTDPQAPVRQNVAKTS